MPDLITWAEVRVGDVLLISGMRWTVTARNDRGAVALRSEAGVSRGGQPPPEGRVQAIERGPLPGVEETETAVAALTRAGLKPAPLCGFSTGTDLCGSDRDVRPYIVGHRCGEHAPGKVSAALAGRKRCKCGGRLPADSKRPDRCLRCGSPVAAR